MAFQSKSSHLHCHIAQKRKDLKGNNVIIDPVINERIMFDVLAYRQFVGWGRGIYRFMGTTAARSGVNAVVDGIGVSRIMRDRTW